MNKSLKALPDDTLTGGPPAGLKDSIDRLLRAGEPKKKVLAVVRRAVPHSAPLTLAAAEAYIGRK